MDFSVEPTNNNYKTHYCQILGASSDHESTLSGGLHTNVIIQYCGR